VRDGLKLLVVSMIFLAGFTPMPAMAWWAVQCPGEPYLGYAVSLSLFAAFLLLPCICKYILMSQIGIEFEGFRSLFLRINAALFLPNLVSAACFTRHFNIATKSGDYAGHIVWILAGLAGLIVTTAIEGSVYSLRRKGVKNFLLTFIAAVFGWALSLGIFFYLIFSYPWSPSVYDYRDCWIKKVTVSK